MVRKNGVPRERADCILRLLREIGSPSLEDICTSVGVSQITARRDLKQLEKLGFLRRTTGAAVPLEPMLYKPFLHDSTFQERLEHFDVFLTGGHMRGDWFSLAGADAVRTVQQFSADIAFIGVDGIEPDRGLTCFNADEAVLNAAFVEHAKQRVVVADHSKLSVIATHRVCPLEAVHVLITDVGASEADVAPYAERGVEVRRV
jgi:DeoR family transcriptional regulator of aga operon